MWKGSVVEVVKTRKERRTGSGFEMKEIRGPNFPLGGVGWRGVRGGGGEVLAGGSRRPLGTTTTNTSSFEGGWGGKRTRT